MTPQQSEAGILQDVTNVSASAVTRSKSEAAIEAYISADTSSAETSDGDTSSATGSACERLTCMLRTAVRRTSETKAQNESLNGELCRLKVRVCCQCTSHCTYTV